MSEQELESIKSLFQSDDINNHKLGIRLTISLGMTDDDLANKYNDCWFSNSVDVWNNPSISIGDYYITWGSLRGRVILYSPIFPLNGT
jgi:hypothetical protein